MADHAVITVGVMHAEVLRHAVDMIGKGGNVVVTAVGGEGDTIAIHGSPVTGFHKNIQGSLFGGANPLYDMPRLLGLYKNGDLKLDELITHRYSARQHQPGLRGHARGSQHPRRPDPRPLTLGKKLRMDPVTSQATIEEAT